MDSRIQINRSKVDWYLWNVNDGSDSAICQSITACILLHVEWHIVGAKEDNKRNEVEPYRHEDDSNKSVNAQGSHVQNTSFSEASIDILR